MLTFIVEERLKAGLLLRGSTVVSYLYIIRKPSPKNEVLYKNSNGYVRPNFLIVTKHHEVASLPLDNWFICQFVGLFVRSFVRSFVRRFVHHAQIGCTNQTIDCRAHLSIA